jgi:cell wall-associated NlpC family hydrolase
VRPLIVFVAFVACSNASSAPAPEQLSTNPPVRPQVEAHAPAVVPQWGDATVTDRIAAVHLVASVDNALATDRPTYARADQHVTLHAVIAVGKHFYADVSEAKLGTRTVHPDPLARAPRFSIAWERVEPAAASYSNTDGGEFHFAAIDYRTTAIADAYETVLAADVRPTLTPDHGHGVGTMRYRAVVTQGDATIASPGPEARRGRGSGGLTDAVLRATIRRDDTYLGYLTEMYGQPYIWASAGLSDSTHESERLEGSDCADFVVYGARRAGKKLAYTWTGGLPGITKLLAAGTRGDDGIYRDAAGKPLAFPKPGDLILFPRHVGVAVEDRGTIGVLDDQDVMMHTLFDSPKEQPIADSGYADKPVELRRFK